MAGNVPLGETGTGVRKEVVPLALERVVVSAVPQSGVVFGDDLLCQIGVEPSTPLAERARVVCREGNNVNMLKNDVRECTWITHVLHDFPPLRV